MTSSTEDVVTLHARAVDRFARLVGEIGPGQWTNATPCTEWDVRALVNHVVGECLWTVPIMEGKTIAEVGGAFDGDVLGADPVATSAAACRAASEAVSEPGAMDRIVHLSFGDVPGREYAWQLFADYLIHGWDLARGIGADERMDADLVAACTSWWRGWEKSYRDGGSVAAAVDVGPDADPQARLLASFGRQP